MTDDSTIEMLAERYRRNGYEVTPRPPEADVPAFLNGFIPDLIVKKGNENIMSLGEWKAACLVGWAAIEASMRAIAAMDGVVLEHKTPGFVLKTLYSQGILSREEFESLERVMRVCNAIAHGLEPGDVQEDALRLLLDCAARLLNLASRTAA